MSDAVADELAIRHLVAAYADGVNRRDVETWGATWAEAGIWELPGRTAEGKQDVIELWLGAMSAYEFVVQLVYNGTLSTEGDRASGRWYLCEHLRPAGTEGGFFSIGTYADDYVREQGEWKFAKRSYHVLYNDEGKGDMTGIVTPLPQS